MPPKHFGPHPYFFTNTSSIPIHFLEELSGLTGRLVGFHFYNPPPVQKLVELIIPKDASEHISQLSPKKWWKNCKKMRSIPTTSQVSSAMATLSGKLWRRGVWSSGSQSRCLSRGYRLCQYAYQQWLLRPMGIFQLVDYVGIDVCACRS